MNEIQIFKNPQFGEIRTAGTADNPMFCLSDVCKSLGLSAKGVNQRLSDKVISKYPIKDSLGRTQQALFINEDGLYDVIFDSRKPKARQFRKWVTSEVLPAIRKTGGYMATKQDDTPESIMARAVLVAQETMKRQERELEAAKERIELQNDELRKQAPKVKYFDDVLQSSRTYTSTQMSKELGLREAEQLHKILKEGGFMFKQSGQWMLTAKYCERGYTKPRTCQFTRSDGTIGTNTTTVWTEKGRQWLHELHGNVKC